MKKFLSLSATVLFVALSATGCSNKEETRRTLTIYNWQDYIFEGDDETDSTIDQFIEYYYEKTGERINVEYYTFETNENMLNVLKTGKSQYDLVCPSDYVIQKMIMEDMVEPFTKPIENFEKYGSPYIKDEIFKKSKVTLENGDEVYWSDYSIPYFWGTMGFMYDPSALPEDYNVATWDVLWDKDLKGYSTLKDSVRDTYCAGVLHTYTDLTNPKVGYSLNELEERYNLGIISASDYTQAIQTIMNDTSEETLALVEKDLKNAKANVYGFEVDSGKSDIVTGKIAINFCWSGDAVYAMDCAEEESDVYLDYVVPEEGSNVWFDGWVMPKGAQVDLAEEFLNFICLPEISAINMDEVGYTSSTAGQDIFDMIKEWYGSESVYDEDGEKILSQSEINQMLNDEELYEFDLSYFFGDTIENDGNEDGLNDGIIYADEINRQFSAQYPTYETIIRCAVMEDFGDRNEAVLEMWVRVKGNDVPVWAYVFILILVVIAVIYGVIYHTNKKARNSRIKEKKELLKATQKSSKKI